MQAGLSKHQLENKLRHHEEPHFTSGCVGHSDRYGNRCGHTCGGCLVPRAGRNNRQTPIFDASCVLYCFLFWYLVVRAVESAPSKDVLDVVLATVCAPRNWSAAFHFTFSPSSH